MSTITRTTSVTGSDRELMRSTLIFLDSVLVGKTVIHVAMGLVLEWSSHALRTLIAFTTSLSELGIESEYLKLLADFFFLGKSVCYMRWQYVVYVVLFIDRILRG